MHSNNEPNRNIPEAIKREVRRRCGFGCVLCGLPLYEYEHMKEWAEVKRHVAEEITLLCDQHHREKTGGLLPVEKVQSANREPFNLRKGVTPPFNLHYGGNTAEILIGGNSIITNRLQEGFIALAIDGTVLIGFHFEDGHALLNIKIFDENNNCILIIERNQLNYSISSWDIEMIGQRLTIRSAAREILIEMIFSPPSKINITRGRILHNGIEILVRPSHIFIVNCAHFIKGDIIEDCASGYTIGNLVLPGAMAIRGINRYKYDRTAALAMEREAIKNPEY